MFNLTKIIGFVRTKITDGTNTATIRDLTNGDALNVSIVDANGDQITSFGEGGGGPDISKLEGNSALITGALLSLINNTTSGNMNVHVSNTSDAPVTIQGEVSTTGETSPIQEQAYFWKMYSDGITVS